VVGELLGRPLHLVVDPALLVDVPALAVDAHRRGDHEPLDLVAGQRLEEHARAVAVDRGVPSDLVHALPDADHRREVDDRVDADERVAQRERVAHVAHDQLDRVREVGRAMPPGPVDLRIERVEDPHPPPDAQELVREVGSDEAGAPGDQHLLRHGPGGTDCRAA